LLKIEQAKKVHHKHLTLFDCSISNKEKQLHPLIPGGNMEPVPRMRGKNSPNTIFEYSAMTNLL
jgi:hypothetical protein